MIDNVRLLCRESDSFTYVWDNTKNTTQDVTVIVEIMSYNTSDLHFILPSKVTLFLTIFKYYCLKLIFLEIKLVDEPQYKNHTYVFAQNSTLNLLY